jgi:nucleotide-binding universal stress UspA family protein
MKKIVVPTDFSEQAGNALDFAYEIARKSDAKITLLHVIEHAAHRATFMGSTSLSATVDISTGVEMDDIYYIELFKRRKQQMAEVLSDPKFEKMDIDDKIMLGTPYDAIEDEITETEADLIVMGTAGVSNWEESLIGSVAEKVVRHASCPVFTLRYPVSLENIHRIAFASDLKDKDAPYLDLVKQLQDFFSAEMNFVYINTPSDFKNERDIKSTMKSVAEAHDFKYFKMHVYSNKSEEEGIVQFSEDYKMDMIMMATYGRTGLSRIFDHSIAEDVVNFSKRPVLTFNLHKLRRSK